jgi:hypothetical protein
MVPFLKDAVPGSTKCTDRQKPVRSSRRYEPACSLQGLGQDRASVFLAEFGIEITRGITHALALIERITNGAERQSSTARGVSTRRALLIRSADDQRRDPPPLTRWHAFMSLTFSV